MTIDPTPSSRGRGCRRLLSLAVAIWLVSSGVFPASAADKQTDIPVDRFREFFLDGSLAGDVLFDGAYIWVADGYNNTVIKVQPDDGTVLATYPTMGVQPQFLAFDGENIWVSHYGIFGSVNKLSAIDGTFLGAFYAGEYPADLVYADGKIWVAAGYGGSILRASDGKNLGGFGGYGGAGVTFDGENVWVTNNFTTSVMKYRASDNTLLGDFGVGNDPVGVAFGLGNIWVANFSDNTVTKLDASDGTLLGTFRSGGSYPIYVASDSTGNAWVTHLDATVSILEGRNGAVKERYPYFSQGKISSDDSNIWITRGANIVRFAPEAPAPYHRKKFQVKAARGLTFDGTNIWVAQDGPATVTELRASDGTVVGVFPAGGSLNNAITFDGTYIWVVNYGEDQVTRLLQSDGSMQGSFPVGELPTSILFDGANIWVTNGEGNTVTKLRASDGALLGTFTVGSFPRGIAFDGTNIWVTNMNSDTVTKLRGSDGARLGTFTLGDEPYGIVFDGTYIWVSNYGNSTVTKLQPSDGTILETAEVGHNPQGLAVSGTNLLLACQGADTVEQRARDTADYQHNYGYVRLPSTVIFDGTSIWVSSRNGVSKITPDTP